tara:strand:+ start:2253 stop:3224 length:972 start_codon:yes stop_codon:yes gene_type:complete
MIETTITLCVINSFIIILYAKKIAYFLKIIDIPNEKHKNHKDPIPAIGGLVFLINLFFVVTFLLVQKSNISFNLVFLILIIIFFFVGILDDRYKLSVNCRIFILLAALFLLLPLSNYTIINKLYFKDIDYVINLKNASLFFSVFSIFFFYNAVNFSDGSNCVCLSLSIFWSIILINKIGYNEILIVLLITSFILLFFNFRNKIFLGNSGSNIISIIFGILFIKFYNLELIKADEITLLILLPCIDALKVVMLRIYNGKSPFHPDNSHIHHLIDSKFNQKYTFLIYITLAIIPYLTNFIFPSYLALIMFFIFYSAINFILTKVK